MRRNWVLMGLTVAAVGGVLFYLRFPRHSKAVTQAEVQALTAQLASLFASRQHSLVSALEAAAQQTPNPYLRQVLPQIRSDVQQNVCLYRAMEKYPDVFSPAYIFAVKHGTNCSRGIAVFKEIAQRWSSDPEQQWVIARHIVKRCALEALKDGDWMNRGFALRALRK